MRRASSGIALKAATGLATIAGQGLKAGWKAYTRQGPKAKVVLGAAFIGATTYLTSPIYYPFMNIQERDCLVTDKIPKDGKYLIFTENCDVFENTDRRWPHWKTNSSTIQGKVIEGEVMRIKSYGYRFSPLSMYPNVLGAKRAPTAQPAGMN